MYCTIRNYQYKSIYLLNFKITQILKYKLDTYKTKLNNNYHLPSVTLLEISRS